VQISDQFNARVVFRSDSAATPVRWAQTHEFRGTGITGDLFVDEDALINGIVGFHAPMLMPNFWIEAVVLSSAAPDGQPYNPETFLSRTIMARGERSAGTDAASQVLPLTSTLLIKRQVGAGREGNMLFRGFLTEGDIVSDPLTGIVTLVARENVASVVTAGWTALSAAVSGAGAEMVLRSGAGAGANVRIVTGLKLKSVGTKKLNNKYFDRQAASPTQGLFDGLVEQYGAQVVGNIVQYLIGSGGTVPPLLP